MLKPEEGKKAPRLNLMKLTDFKKAKHIIPQPTQDTQEMEYPTQETEYPTQETKYPIQEVQELLHKWSEHSHYNTVICI